LNGWIAKAVNIDALSATAISSSILFIEGVPPLPGANVTTEAKDCDEFTHRVPPFKVPNKAVDFMDESLVAPAKKD
jgi:hypothetical protein